ncbi:MAG: GT4 family glycosyltransferase PelF [Magnetococcales bacterium]|nr:GT4 family glycosyltransferase PelF [Magnetococcales bacterium]
MKGLRAPPAMADICMVVEGTYPYVAGGVSSWAHDIIRSLPELSFSLVAILAPNTDLTPRYQLPPNVIGVHHIFLSPFKAKRRWTFRRPGAPFFQALEAALWEFTEHPGIVTLHQLIRLLKEQRETLGWDLLMNSRLSWNMLLKLYARMLPDGPFLDFFWTWRYLMGNLFVILMADLPPARAYHAVSTGFAGLFLARAHLESGRPVFVTEHGIYTNERRIEINMADWLYEKPRSSLQVDHAERDLKGLWIHSFQAYSLVCYQASAWIITLYSGNQVFQRADGADPVKMRIIPNGIHWEAFDKICPEPDRPPTVALIGRVVPIKDIKSYIRACAILRDAIPTARAYVLGPTEEDMGYFDECMQLIVHLGLGGMFEFTGRVKLTEWMGRIDINVLTSISEGQPLVILEAGAAGIPTVSTDVGGCREMIEGHQDEDPPLGHAGIITRVSSPAETAQALIRLLSDRETYDRFSAAIRARVKKYYALGDLKQTYSGIYAELCARPDEERL